MLLPLEARHPQTHSSSTFGWDDLKAEAFGEMGLHPWELDHYTMSDYIAKRKGHQAKELTEWHRVRIVAYYAASGYLKKGTKLQDILPLPGDKVMNKQQKGESLKEWYEKRKALEIKLGLRDGE